MRYRYFFCVLLLAFFWQTQLSLSVQGRPSEEPTLVLEKAKLDVSHKQYKHAFARVQALAERGQPMAEHLTGMMYERGIGVKPNLTKAVYYYRRSAEHGFADAESKIGHMYLLGNSVLYKDLSQAKDWLTRAADKAIPEAEYSLGMLHANGDGPLQDLAKAGQYLRAAAAHGIVEAEQALAKLPALPAAGSAQGVLGKPGEAYGQGLSSIKEAWGGYKEMVQELDKAAAGQS